mgnify:CR=1 FL=1
MQKESIERLRVGAYQSSREEVKRRGKEKRCREMHTKRGPEIGLSWGVQINMLRRFAERGCRKGVQI